MSTEAYRSAWDSYRGSLAQIYSRDVRSLIAMDGPSEVEQPEGAVLDEALDASERLSLAAGEQLDGASAADRELAETQLVAAAALDVAVANDLVRREHEEVDASGSVSQVLPEVVPVLDAQGLEEIAGPLRAAAFEAPEDETVAAMVKAVNGTVDGIREEAADRGQLAIVGIGDLEVALGKALGTAFKEALGLLGEKIGFFVQRAISFVVKGIQKLLKLLGIDAGEAIDKKLKEWREALEKGEGVDTVLNWLWGTEKIKADAAKALEAADGKLTPERMEAADGQLTELAGRFKKQMKILGIVLKGLGLIAGPVALVTNGPIFLAVGFGIGLSYATAAGADFVDWHRVDMDGFFDRVDGVRHVVGDAVA